MSDPLGSRPFAELTLPVFDEPQREPWPAPIPWVNVMRQSAPFRDHYLAHHDTPERRLADKNPAPFVLD